MNFSTYMIGFNTVLLDYLREFDLVEVVNLPIIHMHEFFFSFVLFFWGVFGLVNIGRGAAQGYISNASNDLP